jgi:hypothetical protein
MYAYTHTYTKMHTHIYMQLSLGPDQIGEDSVRTLFELADADNNGSVDFTEFLGVVVGNIASV